MFSATKLKEEAAMDTGTHLMFGLGLGGLAMVDPVIAGHPHGPVAILFATVLGSNAPDWDMLLRFKSNADYIKHHRGLSHSLPAILVWTFLTTLAVMWIFPEVAWGHVAFWVLLSVIVHVFTDLFNSYGTQAYRPLRKKWVRWNIIHIFDPFLFASHLLAVFLWAAEAARPQVIFPVLYCMVALYYGWRTYVHWKLGKTVPLADPEGKPGDRYTILPTLSLSRWNIVHEAGNAYKIGEWDHGKIRWHESLTCENHPAADASRNIPEVQAFLGVTPFPCASVKRQSWGYEVRWVDIRYRYRRQYPFVAVVLMDFSYDPLSSYVGWLSDERLEKKLHMNTY
jgi:inner membrane protein